MNGMLATTLGGLAILGYLAAARAIYRWPGNDFAVDRKDLRRLVGLGLGAVAAALHAVAMIGPLAAGQGLNFSFLNALSLVGWIVVVIVLFTAAFKPVEKLGLVAFPLAALLLAAKLLIPEEVRAVRDPSWSMTLHIVSSVTAYAFLNIAAIQAILLAIQDWCLRHRQLSGVLVRSLPPVQTMETLLFQLIGAGFVLLTGSLLSGFLFLENMFAQHLAHKTILSLTAWLVFAILLVGRSLYGWRGKLAIRWTLSGYLALMLAYFGSKMVLEWILRRT